MSAGGSGKAPACVPTWKGHIETTKDALIIFQACFDGTLSHCFRRPHDRERNQLIVSGNVFVYEEATSGIKRWTDGIPWSPSRILTNFLIYRQLNSPFPPGEKKRATKRSQRPLKPGEPYPGPGSNSGTPTTDRHESSFPTSGSTSPTTKKEDSPDKDSNRGLVGSLVDSYEFKENGLLKKTMTVTVNNVQHHLVSYYSLEEAKYKLKTPREDDRLKNIVLQDSLVQQPKFKFPNLDDAGDGSFDQMDGTANAYPGAYYHNGYNPYAPPHMGYPVQATQPYAYQGAYAPSHPPPTGAYGHMPPTTGPYQPVAASPHYPQHQSQGGYYAQHGQHLPQYQGPPQQSPGYPPHGYQMHQHPQTPVPARHPSHVKSESIPRTNGSYEYPSHAESGSDMYGGSGGASGPPPSESVLPVAQQPHQAQTWPVGGYSQQQQQSQHPPATPQQGWGARPDAPAYPSYRQQS